MFIPSQLYDKNIPYKIREFVVDDPRLTIFNHRIFYRISATTKNMLNRQI